MKTKLVLCILIITVLATSVATAVKYNSNQVDEFEKLVQSYVPYVDWDSFTSVKTACIIDQSEGKWAKPIRNLCDGNWESFTTVKSGSPALIISAPAKKSTEAVLIVRDSAWAQVFPLRNDCIANKKVQVKIQIGKDPNNGVYMTNLYCKNSEKGWFHLAMWESGDELYESKLYLQNQCKQR